MTGKIPFRIGPMLPTLVAEPLDRQDWVYEEKYDGYRILAYKEGSRVTLLSRNGKDRTETYPGVAAAIAKLLASTLLLDGEVVAFDKHRVTRFQLLQEGKAAPLYAVFDCLYQNGRDLRAKPLSVRRRLMEAAIRGSKVLFASHRLNPNGLQAFQDAKARGYEGVVAKDRESPYTEGRTRRWLKFKVHQEDEFVIAGYTQPAGARAHIYTNEAHTLGERLESEVTKTAALDQHWTQVKRGEPSTPYNHSVRLERGKVEVERPGISL